MGLLLHSVRTRRAALRSAVLQAVCAALASGCGNDESTATRKGTTGPDGSMVSGADGSAGPPLDGSRGADGSGIDGSADPCAANAAGPDAATTYYVAIGQAGADDALCDGLAPTDEGGGHCPFHDFSSTKTRSLLNGTSGVKVVVRSGTYVIDGWSGLNVTGIGSSESERVVLTSYPGEDVVFDVPSGDGADCAGADPSSNPNCVREVIRISGQYTWVQGISVRNGLAYDTEVTGGAHHVVRCMKFGYTKEFPQRSDCVKLDAGASDVLIQNNAFTGWHSQGIDMAFVVNAVIEGNEFSHPHDADSGATGSKFGTRGVTIRNNFVHDLGSDPKAHVFSLGGTGSPHPDTFEAEDIHVIGNRVANVAGIVAQVVSCNGCSVEKNDFSDAGAGILISASATGSPECSASTTGCLPSENTRIAGNRMRDLNGGGSATTANVFVVADAGQGSGFESEQNLYCVPSDADARFAWGGGGFVGFAEWQSQSGTDATSRVLASTAAECTAF